MLTNICGIKSYSAVIPSNTRLASQVDNYQPAEASNLWILPSGIYAGKQKLPNNLAPKGRTHLLSKRENTFVKLRITASDLLWII
jgi:hypothetical protein